MKKFAGIMVATVLAFSLVACGPVDSAVQNLAGAASNKGSDVVTADDDGYAEGRIGDVMRTYFFDYTVNSAYTCKEFEGYTPAEGNKLLLRTQIVLRLPCMIPISRSSGAMMTMTMLLMHRLPIIVMP